MNPDLGLIKFFLVAGSISLATAIVCPDSSQWRLRARARCNSSHPSYNCLYDESSSKFVDFCTRKPDYQRPGYKFIIRGNLDGIECVRNRFQPIKFWTNGSNDCILEKTACNEDGQVIHEEGNSTSDRTCRCDYTRGFAFVSTPKQDCYCNPSLEDCSCFVEPCSKFQVMTPDYNCIKATDWNGIFKCPVFTKTLLTMTTPQKSTRCPTAPDLRKFSITTTVKRQSAFTVSGLIVVGIIIGIFFFACGRNVMECCRNTYLIGTHYDKIKGGLDQVDKLVHLENGNTYLIGTHYDKIKGGLDQVDKLVHLENDLYFPWIHDWEKDDEKFIITKATERIEKQLSHVHSVVVVGCSGNGKSSIIRHIALKLSNERNMEIIPFVNEPSDIFKFHCQSRNQVFVIDDFCGKDVINPHKVQIWFSRINEILKLMNKQQSSVRFLFSVGHDIYNDYIFQPLESLKEYVVNLSDFTLTENEKKEMIYKYIPFEMQSQSNMYKETDGFNKDYYPVLCKIAEGKSAEQIKNIFTDFDDFIKNDILDLKRKQSLQFYFITYCALFNNRFKVSMLDGLFSSDHEQTAFYEMCMVFHHGLHKKPAGKRLKEYINSLKNGYVEQTEDYCHFVHRKIYQVAAIVCGQSFVNCYIKFASYSFIAEHYCFKSINRGGTGNVIWVDDKDDTEKNLYLDRLMEDLKVGVTYSTFHNSQLHYTKYRDLFCAYCYDRKQRVIAVLYNLKNMNQSQILNDCEENEQDFNDENLDYEDYIDFEKQFHFASHSMRQPILESAWEGYADIVKMLLEMGLDVDQTDRFGRSALIVASHRGKKEVVQILLENNANYSLLDNKKQSALLAASRKGHDEIVQLLIDKNADTSVRDLDGYTPFLAACKGDHTIIAAMLLKRDVDISVCDNMDQSSLYLACLNDCKDVVSYIISLNSDKLLNKCNRKGMSPLSIACMKRYTELVKLLLEAGADVTTRNSDGRTPLFIACQEGHIEIVDILVKRGADITTCDWQDHTLLTIACERGHSETVNFLLKQTSSLIDKPSKDCRTPLFIACEKGHLNIVNILLKNKADIEKQDNEKRSPFYVACRCGHLAVAKLLFKHKADISICNKWGGSPLFTACREGHNAIAQFLIDNNSKFDADENGTTPLLVACEEGNTEIAKLLIAKDAGINMKNAEGRFPLHCAVFCGHTEIVKALIDKSADTSLEDADGKTSLDIAKNKGFSDIENILRVGSNEKL